MTESIHSPEYRHVLAKLIDMRTEAGMTQRDLAKVLERENSFVSRIETGKRRLDVVEFYWVCKALGKNAAVVYRGIIQEITAMTSPVSVSQKKVKSGVSRKNLRRKQ
jgi:transcriptional regulator with XRE-family HTH domain